LETNPLIIVYILNNLQNLIFNYKIMKLKYIKEKSIKLKNLNFLMKKFVK